MVTENYERLGRRLREHQRKLGAPVGTRHGAVTLILFEAWNEQAGGRGRVLYVRMPGLHIDACRRLAAAALGPDWLAGLEEYDAGPNEAWFVAPLDPLRLRAGWSAGFNLPRVVRWFNARKLAAGIGADGGFLTFNGLSIELAE